MIFQKTINNETSITGIGIHSGKEVKMSFLPGKPNQGIRIIRTDLPNSPSVSGDWSNVVDTSLAIVLGTEGFIASTVEHLFASLYGAGIDNLDILINSYELPILDGSSLPSYKAIKNAGIVTQNSFRKYLFIKQPINHVEGDRYICAMPSDKLTINIKGYQTFSMVGHKLSYDFSEASFADEIASARTTFYLDEAPIMKQYGLFLGGSSENSVLLDKNRVLNPEGLRFHDEMLRHRIIDFLGTLRLVGMPVLSEFFINGADESLFYGFLKQLFSDKNNYDIVTMHYLDDLSEKKISEHKSSIFLSDNLYNDAFVYTQKNEFNFGTIEDLQSPKELTLAHPLIEKMVAKVHMVSQNTQLLNENRSLSFNIDRNGNVVVNLLRKESSSMSGQKIDSPKSKNMSIINIDGKPGRVNISTANNVNSEINYYQDANRFIDEILYCIAEINEISPDTKKELNKRVAELRVSVNNDSVEEEFVKILFNDLILKGDSIKKKVYDFMVSLSSSTLGSALYEGLKQLF